MLTSLKVITKQPVGSQHLRGFGKTLAHRFLAIEEVLLPRAAFSESMISKQPVIRESCNGLYNSERPDLLKEQTG